MEFIKIAFLACAVSLLMVLVSQMKPEFAQIMQVSCVLVIVAMLSDDFIDLLKSVNSITGSIKLEGGYFPLLIKALLTATVAKIAGDVCRDCGSNSIASTVELAGKLAVLMLSMPIISAITEAAGTLISS